MRAAQAASSSSPAPVVVFACGHPDRGDDAAAAMAVAQLDGVTRARAEVRVCHTLEPDTLAGLAPGVGVVIVDAAAGPEVGQVIVIDLAGLDDLPHNVAVASSHQLPLPALIGLAGILRGSPIEGRLVAIGVAQVEPGAGLSKAVDSRLPSLTRAVEDAVLQVAQQTGAGLDQPSSTGSASPRRTSPLMASTGSRPTPS